MKNTTLRIATRQSPLALWQANFIKQQLQNHFDNLEISIIGMTTKGDKLLGTSLSKVGGKGLFIKELEHALLEDKADIAVHSMKDMTVHLPKGLCIATICQRAEVEDAFVSNKYSSLEALPKGSIIGTSSLRRQSQLSAMRPDVEIKTLRGNVNSRLEKLDNGEFDAIILAVAGLKRLGFDKRITAILKTQQCLPAIAQGTLGIECVEDNSRVKEMISVLEHTPTRICLNAERAINERLEGGCSVPIAGLASIENSQLNVEGLVGKPDGTQLLTATRHGQLDDAVAIGYAVADDLLSQGAEEILKALR